MRPKFRASFPLALSGWGHESTTDERAPAGVHCSIAIPGIGPTGTLKHSIRMVLLSLAPASWPLRSRLIRHHVAKQLREKHVRDRGCRPEGSSQARATPPWLLQGASQRVPRGRSLPRRAVAVEPCQGHMKKRHDQVDHLSLEALQRGLPWVPELCDPWRDVFVVEQSERP